jgi:hypothetical protein
VTGKMKFFMKFLNPYGLVPVPAVSTLPAIAMTGDSETAGNTPWISSLKYATPVRHNAWLYM